MTGGRDESRATSPSPSRKRGVPPRLLGVSLTLVFGVLYFTTLTSDHSVDAVIYAGNAELAAVSGRPSLRIFNPAHVLHTAIGAGATWLLFLAGIPVRSLTLMQVWSAGSGALLAGALFLWLCRSTGAKWLSAASAAALAVAGGVWAFAVQGEPNLPSLAVAAAALLPVASLLASSEEENGKWATVGAAGLLLGAAAALHLTLGTLWIGLLACMVFRGRRRRLRILAVLAIACFVLGIAYIPRAVLLQGEAGAEVLDLITFSGESPYPAYLGRSSFQPLGQVVATIMGFAPAESGGIWSALAWAGRLVPCVWMLAALGALGLKRVRSGRSGPLLVLTLVWFLCNVLLFAAWADRNFEFFAFLLVPLCGAGTLGIAELARSVERPIAAAIFLCGLVTAAVVWVGTVGPARDPAGNPALLAAELVARETAPTDHVLMAGGPETRLKVYVPYFAGRRIIVPDFFYGPSLTPEASAQRLAERVEQACRQGRVWVLGDMGAPTGIEAFEGIPYGDVRRWLQTLRPKERARTEEGTILWLLDGCPG